MARSQNDARKHTAAAVGDCRVAGPLNDPLIQAYERLHDRLAKEQNEAEELYQKMALSRAVRALLNAIEIERLIRGPYER